MTQRRLAVVDLGTNSARLAFLVVSAAGASHVEAAGRIPCRLGEDLAASGALGAAACARALGALQTLAAAARDAERLLVVGTYALRTARDAAGFVDAVRRQLGLEIRVLSGAEEARLVLDAARRRAQTAADLVCLDLGGGSLELARDSHPDPVLVSLPLGAVLTAAVLEAPATAAQLGTLRREASRVLVERAAPFASSAPDRLLAAGGTVTTACRLLGRQSPLDGAVVRRTEFEALLQRLAPLDLAARRRVPGMDADRADIIVSGLAVLDETLRFLAAEELHVHEHGVREGVLWAMWEGRM